MNDVLKNFYTVLRYAKDNYLTDGCMPESALLATNESINPSDIISTLSESIDSINEASVRIGEPHKVREGKGTGLSLTVNGKEYRYVSPDIDIDSLLRSVHGMWKHGGGWNIVNYLKKNALCYYGAKRPSQEGKDLVGYKESAIFGTIHTLNRMNS